MGTRRLARRQCVSCSAPTSPGDRQCATCERSVVTVMVADLSGSTALGEKLDPEELRSILAGFFRDLSREIQREGGSVDKYVGDAIRARFSGSPADSSAVRAVRAGLAMQEALARQNAELERLYGVRLSLRVGINTGAVVSGAGRDARAAALVLGDTVTLAQRLESDAEPNTVLVGERTRLIAQDAFVFELRELAAKGSGPSIAAHVVRKSRKRVGAHAAESVMVSEGSASLQVGEQKAHVLEEQRKVVTVLFADLATPLEALDPDAIGRVLATYFEVVAKQIAYFGGTIDKYVGDAVMAVFGAPISHEDDAARAVRSALAIQAAIARENAGLDAREGIELAVRIGINTGEVVAGLLPGEVLAYTVTGDTVNTAQRIESAATAGQVLISESTHALARHSFVVDAVPPLTLKGKREPVPAYQVLGRERRATPRGGPTLVGRRGELERLYASLRDAGVGQGTVLHIHGEAGVGKSRIIAEFLSGLPREMIRLRARASSYETATAYALVADILRRAFRIQVADAEPVAAAALHAGLDTVTVVPLDAAIALLLEILGYGERSLLDPERKRRALVALLRALLERYSDAGPFIVVAEDTHWIDPASASVLADLSPAIGGLRCLLITTSRDEAGAPPGAEPMKVEPLGEDDAAALVDGIAGGQLDERTRTLILARTEGNPFFIEEVARQIASGRSTAVPTSIQDMLEARIDALDASPKHVAQRAAVIGRTFWTRILEHVTPDEPLEPALRTLQEERFVVPREQVPERTFGFPHALVQEVVYGTQLISQRRTSHGAIGAAIEELFRERIEEFTDTLAFHYDRSNRDTKALEWLVRAGDRARALYANDEALTSYRSALRRASDGTGLVDAATILERIADVETLVGSYDAAITSYEGARARLGGEDHVAEARLWRKSGTAQQMRAQYDDARAAFARARKALAGTDDAERARVELEEGQLAWRLGDYEAARAALTDAIRRGERLGADDVLAEGLKQLGNVSFLTGRSEDALASYRRSLEIYERRADAAGLANVHSNLGVVHRRRGEWDDALRELGESLRLRERMGDPWGIGTVHNNIGEVHRTRGELDEAVRAYERAIATWTRIRYESGVALALSGLGAAQVEQGEVESGLASLRDAERRWTALGSRTYLPDLHRFLASAHLARGDLDEADASIERSLALAREADARHQIAMSERVRGEIAAARGDDERAQTLLEASRDALRELGEWAELGRTEAVIARLAVSGR